MLMSPCDAPLVNGMHGTMSGYLQRTKAIVDLTQTAAVTNTCGYIIWAPRYFSPGVGIQSDVGSTARNQMNLFLWQSGDAGLRPLNSKEVAAGYTDNPPTYGLPRTTTGAWSSTKAIPDPASAFVGGAVCEDARLLSSCIRVTYTGRQMDSAGLICPIRNLSMSDFLVRNDITGEFSAKGLSVNDIFKLAPDQVRLGTEVHEIRSRDSDNELDEWQTHIDPAAYPGVWYGTGTIGVPSAMDPSVSPREPNVYGFAWRDVEASQFTKMYVELFKNFEWRPQSSAGISLPTEERTSAVSNVPKAMQYLDRAKHGWDIARPYVSGAMTFAANVQSANYGGAAVSIGGGIASAFGNSGRRR